MEKKIKVMWLKPTKGQVSIGRRLISEILRKRGFDVNVVECSGLRILKDFSKVLRSDYNIIVGTTHLGLAIGGLTKILQRKKLVADFVDNYETIFNSIPKFFYPFAFTLILLEKLAIKFADAVIVIPYENYQKISKFKKNVFKTNLCIDLGRFIFSDGNLGHAKKLLERNGIDVNKPLIVYVGGFSKIYNLDILIKSMEFLPNSQLIMIGGGKLENDLINLKEKLNLKNVFLLGYLPNEIVAEIMKLCDVGITLCEVPRQLKIYEYLAAGLSVVVPENVFSSKDFEFAEYCLCAKLDIQDVVEKIRTALKKPKKNDKKLIALLDKYSCDRVTDVYEKIIKTLV